MDTNQQTATNLAEPAAVQDELTIDTSDFDIFSSLDDISVEEASTEENTNSKDDVALEEATAEDDTEFNFDDIDEDFEDDSGEEDADEVEEDEEDEYEEPEDEDEGEDDVSDEEEVEYESYQVTLPNGEEVNLAEAVKGYKEAQALEQERQSFQAQIQEFETSASNMKERLNLAKLEAERVIDDYDGFDWIALSREDPVKYVENREFLDRYKQRHNELVATMDKIKVEEREQEQASFQAQAQSCVAELKQDIPGWNDSMYQELMAYAIENGAKQEDITQTVDPLVFKLLHKAHQFDKGKQVVKAKVRKAVRSPKKVAKADKRSAKKPSSKTALIKKMDAGEVSDLDLFNALED